MELFPSVSLLIFKTSPVSALSSTRIGSLPCSSASMSLGLHAEKAPEQMKSM